MPACPNTCAELAAARRAQLEAEQRSTQEGYLAKKAMISEAAAARAEWQATADSLRTQIQDADTLISQLEGETGSGEARAQAPCRWAFILNAAPRVILFAPSAEAQVLEEAEQEALTAYTAAAGPSACAAAPVALSCNALTVCSRPSLWALQRASAAAAVALTTSTASSTSAWSAPASCSATLSPPSTCAAAPTSTRCVPRPLALAHTSPPPAFAHNWP